jgi:putative ABC transport system permease protein
VRRPAAPPAVTAAPKGEPSTVTVTAADPGALTALEVGVAAGRLYDVGHEKRAERVAVVGAGAAETLALGDVSSTPSVYLDGVAYTVVGVLDPATGPPDLGLSMVLPTATALAAYGPPASPRATMAVEARAAHATEVAGQLAMILRPDQPDRFAVHRAPAPQAAQDAAIGQLHRLQWVFAGITLVLAAAIMCLVVPRTVKIARRAGPAFAARAGGAALLGSVVALNVVVLALWLGSRGSGLPVLPRGVVVLATLVPALTTLAFVWHSTRARPRLQPW